MKKQKKETGWVVAVCRSPTAGLLKQPEDQILIGRYGVEGIGDLSNLSEGDQLSFESGVVVEVTEQNEPCANLNVWHKRVLYEVMGKRGIVGVVKKGGTLRPGDAVALKIGRSRRRSPSAAGNNNDVI